MKAERLVGLAVGSSGASGGDAITGGSPTDGAVASDTSRSAAFHFASHSLALGETHGAAIQPPGDADDIVGFRKWQATANPTRRK
jgi:hypothetical protein